VRCRRVQGGLGRLVTTGQGQSLIGEGRRLAVLSYAVRLVSRIGQPP